MKKFLVILLVITTIFGTFCVANAESYIVTTEESRLNIRLADDHSKIVGKLKKGQVFEPDYVDKTWAHFTVKGKHVIAYMGYLTKYSTYLANQGSSSTTKKSSSTSVSSSTKPISECKKYHVVTSGPKLNVRSAASFNSTIITRLNNGATVYVIKKAGSWAKVYYDKTHVGYVWADLIAIG